MSENHNSGVHLVLGVNDRIPAGKAVVLGLQHLLAMDLYVMPVVLAELLMLDLSAKSLLIQMVFFACGLATLIQTSIGIRLPVVQGASYAPLGALAAIGNGLGLGAMVGSLIPGAVLLTLIGRPFKVFSSFVKVFVTPIVAGTVIFVIGIALMPTALDGIFACPDGRLVTVQQNAVIGLSSAVLMVAFVLVGLAFEKRFGKYLRVASVFLAIAGGVAVAAIVRGGVDFSAVGTASWFAFPQVFPLATPVFDWGACLVMVFVYFLVLIETTGTWYTVGIVTGEKLTDERLNGGAFGEGLGCLAGALFGGTPLTGYASNAGVMAITGVASKMAIYAAGGILMVLGLMPKCMSVLASIPGPVISGVFGVVAVIVAMNGFRVLKQVELNEKSMFQIGIPILLALSCSFIPKTLLDSLPSVLGCLFSSGVAVGALASLLLNVLLQGGKKREDHVP